MNKRDPRLILAIRASAAFLISLIALRKSPQHRRNSDATSTGILRLISVGIILYGTVLSHSVHAQECWPPAGEGGDGEASGYIYGPASYVVTGSGGNPIWADGSIMTLSFSGGGGFTHLVGPCEPFSSDNFLGYYNVSTLSEIWDKTWHVGYGGSINIMFSRILSPKNLGTPECLAGVGNPINCGSGNKFQVETDFSGGPNAHLAFRRYYNSMAMNARPLGRKWRGTYDRSVVTHGSTLAEVWREDGRVDLFRPVNGSWETEPDVKITLSEVLSGGAQVGWEVERSDLSIENYDLEGKLTSITTRTGLTTTLTYNGSDQLTTVTGPFGHALTFTYTANGNVHQMTTPEGNVHTYTYDANGNLVSVTYPNTEVRQYAYDNSSFPHALTSIIDEHGNTFATFGYDYAGRAISTEHAQTDNGAPQEKFSIAYNTNPLYSPATSTVTDPAGNAWTYQFQTQHGKKTLTSVVSQVDSKGISQGFDSNNNLTSRTDEEGRTTTYTYNPYNQRTSMTEASGTADARTITYEYLSATEDLVTKVITPSVYNGSDRETITTYDASRNVTAITIQGYDPSGTSVSRTITMDYNADGLVTEIDGPRTGVLDITTLEYYECTTGAECGHLKQVTNAAGHVTTYDAYDDDGRVTQMTDPNNVVTTYTYDFRGQLLTVIETPPTGPARTTTYTYDEAGQLETVTAPNGTMFTYAYDAAHDLKSITDNLGNEIRYRYDLKGNRTDEDVYDPLDTLVKTVDYVYDLRNRIDSINAAGSVTDLVYDAAGNLTDETDPNNNDTAHDYDPLNRLVETLDALSGVTAYGYDVNDHLVSVAAPNGATTTYVYDDLGNLLSLMSPDTGTTTYTYDAAGNRLTQTDAKGITTTYTYDVLNRVATISYLNSSLNVTLTYDELSNQNGRLTTMVDGSGTTTFSYDVFGNLTQESKVVDGDTHITGYAYDAANLPVSIAYPSGRTVDYTRNVLGQIEEVETTYDTTTIMVADNIGYEPFGPLHSLTFGNGLVLSRDYDSQYRLTGQATGSIQDLTFAYDAAGNIDAITDAVNPNVDQVFAQDVLHRIESDSGDYGDIDYTYDESGNRLTKVVDTITEQALTYTTDSNRLATHNGNTVTLDSVGNTTLDVEQSQSFVYDDHNRMTEAYVSAVLQAEYSYNGHGQRVKKTEATGEKRTIVFHYGLNGELIGETVYDELGAKIGERDYVWINGSPVAQSERDFSGTAITNDLFVYLHADQLDTPRLATSGSGEVVWRWDSDAFGVGAADLDPDSDTNEVNVRLRFPGQYFDEETGLNYNLFRDYDPLTGRYLKSDPIGLAGGINTYAYVESNPAVSSDPTGLAKWYGWGRSLDFLLFSRDEYTLESQGCLCGLKIKIRVTVNSVGVSISAFATKSSFLFEDFFDCPNPQAFAGLAQIYTIAAVAGVGTSQSRIMLGRALSLGEWTATQGLGGGVGVTWGVTDVEVLSVENCNSCEP